MADIEELQEKLAEGSDEEEETGSNEPQLDMSFLDERKTSAAESAAQRAAAAAGRAGEKVGGAARGLLTGVGTRLEKSASPPEDDISDLFEAPNMESDNDVYVDDLLQVDEEDVFGEGGEDMSDLLEVPEEDIEVGEETVGVEAPRSPRKTTYRIARPAPPPSGIAGIQ